MTTKKKRTKRKVKTRKIQKNIKAIIGDQKTEAGFDNIPITEKTLWRNDQFGKRKVIDMENFIIRNHIDNGGLATDYNKKRLKTATKEFKRRILLQLKTSPSSRRLFKQKTKKKYNSKTIHKIIDKMSISKIQKLYLFLLKNKKMKKSRKK
tara:strand:+ start:2036 stop:2488 length:453 start_codon:yes stop_codon:yes gene_type:complete